MDRTKKLIRVYYLIIKQILGRYSDNQKKDKETLHNAFKEFYRREYDVDYTSLTEYTRDELTELVNRILIEFSVEYGIYLKAPNEPDNAEELSLSDYLEITNWIMEHQRFTSTKELEHLPEGVDIITSIEALKVLKKGKRSRNIPENLIIDYGRKVYVWSKRHLVYYEKVLHPATPLTQVQEYIDKRILYG